MSPTLWLVTDQLPDPPRNGITLPLYHLGLRLMQQHPLRLVLLEDEAAPPTPQALARNEARFGPVQRIVLRRRGRAVRALAELRGREMYQHGWRLAGPAAPPAVGADDRLLVAPMSAVAAWDACGLAAQVHPRVRLAAVNDCTTAEYHLRRLQQPGRAAPRAALDRWRCRFIAPVEARLLAPYDHVLLQTEADRDWLARLVGTPLAQRVTVVSNGVVDEFFGLQRSGRAAVLFVADLGGEYAGTARWLATQVWPAVAARHPHAELLVIGRRAGPALRAAFAAAPALRHLEHVDDLGAVYADAAVALSPVFKGFGLINKTLEAMAAGLPVVGGAAAFNGVAGFRAGVHGWVCDTPDAAPFSAALDTLLADPARREAIGQAARRLVDGTFRWERAARQVAALLHAPAA